MDQMKIVTREPAAIGAAYRALRAMHGLNMPEMAERMGISEQTLRELEKGNIAKPQRHTLPLCNATGVTLEEFMTVVAIYSASSRRLHHAQVAPR